MTEKNGRTGRTVPDFASGHRHCSTDGVRAAASAPETICLRDRTSTFKVPAVPVPRFPDTSYARLTPCMEGRTILDPFPVRVREEVASTMACVRSKSHRHIELGCCHGRSEEASIQVPPQHATLARCRAPAQVAVLLPMRDSCAVARRLPELWILPRSADDSAAG